MTRLFLTFFALVFALVASTHAGSAATILRGVNISGAEINAGALPGRIGYDYIYPSRAQLERLARDGIQVVRVPVLWERLQPLAGGPLDDAEMGHIGETISVAAANHLDVIVDLHNYGAYRGRLVGSSDLPAAEFAGLWSLLATRLRGAGNVVFGLMNEPHGIAASDWASSEQLAIDAIRKAGARQLILVSGTGWDGAHDFTSGGSYGPPNAPVLADLQDPAGNFAVELHQYLDSDSSGTHDDCRSPNDATGTLIPATDWLRSHHQRGYLGEFAGARSAACMASLDAMLTYLDRNADVWLGWTYWAAGAWWGDYRFSVEPKDGHDAVQMGVLKRHLQAPT